ncbi:HAD domain-containing protein [Lysobacter sp. FW306-1B-D06B]|uniref:HAD domain-containing protein n=1 Tax=Lysobacter sp. FW306-1B-D06B TaxID=3140250 RepID=UPI0031406DE1
MATCATDKLILFLDFDGTLHPLWEFTRNSAGREIARRYEGPWLVHAPLLAGVLQPWLGQIEIVVSSWWAYHRPLDEIRAMLPEALAMRVIDSIWLPELTTPLWSEYHSKLATRHACIRLWLDRRRPAHTRRWLALDADPWPKEDEGRLIRAWGTLGNSKVQRELVDQLERFLCDT